LLAPSFFLFGRFGNTLFDVPGKCRIVGAEATFLTINGCAKPARVNED
jgi:hypothetical protein